MPSFAHRLARTVDRAGAPLCVGLDPDPERLPLPLRAALAEGPEATAEAIVRFCCAITDYTHESAAAFKPNLAFFEALGAPGARALERVCAHVRQTDALLVLDGKRGDVGHTGARYAAALYDRLGGDAVTVAPYMGADSITPFLGHAGRCAFVLVATSNPGADDLQTLDAGGEPLYVHAARLAVKTAEGLPGEAGFVVGATRPERLAGLRAAYPAVPFLVPGVGAQGGSARDVLAANAGGPVLVSSSREILYASPGPDFGEAAGDAARQLAARLAG